jgi:hypothetical protein
VFPDPMGAPMGAPPPPPDPLAGAPPSPEEAPAGDEDVLQMVLEAVRAAEAADGNVTPQERVIFEKITSLIAQLQAQRDKEDQAALGGSPALNSLKRLGG